MKKTNLGILASGRGSNLQSIMEACAVDNYPGKVAVVISDQKEAQALERARRVGIPTYFVNARDYADRAAYEQKIVELLRAESVDLVCLAGYMKLVGEKLLSAFHRRIMNIHPALLPAFPGLNAQKQALLHGVKYSGCTVHFVDEGMDTGPIIMQEVVRVHDEDTVESLSQRILEREHIIYPRAIGLFCAGKLELKGRKVSVRD